MPYMEGLKEDEQQSKTLWMLLPYVSYNTRILVPSTDQLNGYSIYDALANDPTSLPYPEFAYSPIYQNPDDGTVTAGSSNDISGLELSLVIPSDAVLMKMDFMPGMDMNSYVWSIEGAQYQVNSGVSGGIANFNASFSNWPNSYSFSAAEDNTVQLNMNGTEFSPSSDGYAEALAEFQTIFNRD